MPKIIENLESRILEEARKQIEVSGYSALTIRSVGVGTVYNYFPSKDDLVATYMLQEWNNCIAIVAQTSLDADSAELVVRCMYEQLTQYAARYQLLFQDAAAAAGFIGSFSRYHAVLRSQLAQPLQKFCCNGFAAEFVAESLLTWTMAGKPFDDIYGMIGKLF